MRMKRIRATVILAVFMMAPAAQAGSIWAKSQQPIRPLHKDDTARRTGDMLTIIIAEHSVIENETTRGQSKKSSRKASVAGNLDILRGINTITGELFSVPDMNVDMSAENSFDGSADYDTDRKVQDQISVTVADVLPNGNLVVVGTRERDVSGDKQTMQVSGVVRPTDITFANTVQSDQVAEFKIVFLESGSEEQFTKPGWLDRVLNFLNPF